MTTGLRRDREAGNDVTEPSTLVWIDAREAASSAGRTTGLDSSEATGHVRHDPAVRHGGGRAQTAGEQHATCSVLITREGSPQAE